MIYKIIAIVLVVVLVFITILTYVLNKKTKAPACAKPDKEKCSGCKLKDSCKVFDE